MLGWFSLRKFLISVSFSSETFFTATGILFSMPEKTAPWPPQPRNVKSVIWSNGISQSSEIIIMNITIKPEQNYCRDIKKKKLNINQCLHLRCKPFQSISNILIILFQYYVGCFQIKIMYLIIGGTILNFTKYIIISNTVWMTLLFAFLFVLLLIFFI